MMNEFENNKELFQQSQEEESTRREDDITENLQTEPATEESVDAQSSVEQEENAVFEQSAQEPLEEPQKTAYQQDYGYQAFYQPQPPKAKKKNAPWIVAVASALVICLFVGTAVAFSIPRQNNENAVNYHTSDVANNGTNAATQTSLDQFIPDGTELTTQEIAAKVGPSVVGIINIGNTQTYFGQTVEQELGSGSGVIINENGYIVTNYHVIEGATKVQVILNSGKECEGTIVGADETSDIAVVKIDEPNLVYATLGDSSKTMVGERAIAIGNPLGTELMGTLTQGVISAVNRTVEVDNKKMTLLQTDAAINAGNSGGGLFNAYGELIGINTVKMSATGVEGLGFAIPINQVKEVVDDLMEYGYVRGRLVIGVTGTNVTEKISAYYDLPLGFIVNEVTPGSGAEKAGIQPGDVIVKCDGKVIETIDDINEVKDTHQVGDIMTMDIIRNNERISVEVELQEEVPASVQQAQ